MGSGQMDRGLEYQKPVGDQPGLQASLTACRSSQENCFLFDAASGFRQQCGSFTPFTWKIATCSLGCISILLSSHCLCGSSLPRARQAQGQKELKSCFNTNISGGKIIKS